VPPAQSPDLRMGGLLRYASPAVASAMLMGPLGSVVPGIYAKSYNLALTTIAALLLLVRVLDSFSDVAIGIWSDRWVARGGTRRPFIVVGATMLSISSILVAMPLAGYEGVWLTVTMLLALIGWSAFEIPHYAWGVELTPDPVQRSRLFGYRAVAFYSAGLLTFTIPLLPFQPNGEMTPRTLLQIAVIGSLLFAGTLPGLLRLPRGTADAATPRAESAGLAEVLRAIGTCKPLWTFLTAYFLMSFGVAMFGGTLFIFVDVYLGLANKVALVFALGAPIGIVAAPLWARVASRIGRKAAWLLATAGLMLVLIGCGFIVPGPGALSAIFAATVGLYILSSCLATVAPALLGDIVDYGRWKFRRDLAGAYYAAFNLVVKLVASVGAAAGFAIAGAMGFTGHAGANSATAVLGMKLALAWIPALVVLCSVPFIWRMGLTPARLALIQQRLARRSSADANQGLMVEIRT
jgi:GPH family glycoside/pentoside/hexuronide:cation symporter